MSCARVAELADAPDLGTDLLHLDTISAPNSTELQVDCNLRTFNHIDNHF
jgi:hypothetical protein